MKKTIMFLGVLSLGLAHAQQGRVGINTDEPKATLQVKSTSPDEAKGVLIPQLTGDEIKTMTNTLTADQHGLITFATESVTALDNVPTNGIQFPGYHRMSANHEVITGYNKKDNVNYWVRLEPSGLEKVKGTGTNIGWRLVGHNADTRFAPVGNRAIDMSFVTGTRTDMGASGDYAFSVGANNKATKGYSIAIGGGLTSLGQASIAIGSNTNATKNYSLAIGYNSSANGDGSIALGQTNKADGNYSNAQGYRNTTTGNYAFAAGYNNTASGETAITIGASHTVSGQGSSALGKSNEVTGNYSSAIGYYNKATSAYGTALGYRVVASAEGMTAVGIGNTEGPKLFVVGNSDGLGGENLVRSDAFAVLRDGRVGVDIDNFETTTSKSKLQVNGAVKISSDSDTCDGNNAGTIRFKNDKFQGCTSTGWVNLH